MIFYPKINDICTIIGIFLMVVMTLGCKNSDEKRAELRARRDIIQKQNEAIEAQEEKKARIQFELKNKRVEIEREKKLQLEQGEELRVVINHITSQLNTSTSKKIMKNLHVYIQRNSGLLIIKFNIDTSLLREFQSGQIFLHPLLIRLFDNNGQYLTHFKTEDCLFPSNPTTREMTREVFSRRAGRVVRPNYIHLNVGENILKFEINKINAEYTKMLEIAFSN